MLQAFVICGSNFLSFNGDPLSKWLLMATQPEYYSCSNGVKTGKKQAPSFSNTNLKRKLPFSLQPEG